MIPGIDELITRLMYRVLYTFARLIWNVNRVFLAIAEFVGNLEDSLIDATSLFVEYMVNALRVPTVMLLLLALTSIGTWYLLNHILPTKKWVDPSRLTLYGLLAALFFAAPATYIDALEGLRTSLVQAIDVTVIDDGIIDLFTPPDTGTGSGYDDIGMPTAIADINADGTVGTFDFVAYTLHLQNSNEIHRSTFPDGFADTYFPDTPSEIDLSSEGERNAAIELANDGITMLFLTLFALPTAIAEHTLWLVLTLVALLLYIGVPIGLMLSFFVFTESLIANYMRQFIKLMIETLLSTLFAGFAIGIVALASQVGLAAFLAACVVANFVFIWRIIGALKLASAAFDLFGGGTITGGATAKDARQLATATVGGAMTVGAAATGVGLATSAAGFLSAHNQLGKALAPDEHKHLFENNPVNDARIRQLQTLAGYSVGKVKPIRRGIESAHEAMTFGRNFLNGEPKDADPNLLDYLRAGSAASTFGSSPWLAMRMSPSLRKAMDTVGGKTNGLYYEDQAPVSSGTTPMQQLTENLSQLVTVLTAQQGNGARHPGSATLQHAHQEEETNTAVSPVGHSRPAQMSQAHVADAPRPRAKRQDTAVSPATVEPFQALPAEDLFAPPLNKMGAPVVPEHQPSPQSKTQDTQVPILPTTAQMGDTAVSPPASSSPRTLVTKEQFSTTEPDTLDSTDPPATASPLSKITKTQAGAGSSLAQTTNASAESQNRPSTSSPSISISANIGGDSHATAVSNTIQALGANDAAEQGAAYAQIEQAVGTKTADILQGAVNSAGAEHVQLAAQTSITVANEMAQSGLPDSNILSAFQAGEGIEQVQEALGDDSPLTTEQLHAITDVALQPTKDVSSQELATALGTAVEGGGNEADVATALGSQLSNMSAVTGDVRGIIRQAKQMNLTSADMRQIMAQLEQNLFTQVRNLLSEKAGTASDKEQFIQNMHNLQNMNITISQTTNPGGKQDE